MDLTQYGDNELSLMIFNDEGLYKMRHILSKDLLHEFDIKYTDEQWEVFQDDLKSEDD